MPVIIFNILVVSLPAPVFASIGILNGSLLYMKDCTGLTMAAVPDPNASYTLFSLHAFINSWILNCFVDTLNSPKSLQSWMIESLVTPGRIVPSKGGVINSSSPYSFFQKTKKFMVPTSVT
jgi:hypothetical protein